MLTIKLYEKILLGLFILLRRIVFWQKKDMQDGIRAFAIVAQLLSHI